MAKPGAFDWYVTRLINTQSLPGQPTSTSVDHELDVDDKPNKNNNNNNNLPAARDEGKEIMHDRTAIEEPSKLRRAFKVACIASFLLTSAMDFVIAIPMFLPPYVFPQGFFVAWVVVTFCWVFFSMAVSVILPIWETRGFLGGLW